MITRLDQITDMIIAANINDPAKILQQANDKGIFTDNYVIAAKELAKIELIEERKNGIIWS